MAEREIKTTLALDGEKQFKASMDEAYRGMKVLGSEMKLNTAIFGDNAKSMEGLTNKGQILEREISQQKEIVSALSQAVKDAAASYGENDKRTDEYRVKLNNATSALNRMEGELQQNETAIKNFGKETKTAEQRSKEWHDALKKLNDGLSQGIDVLGPVAAGIAAIGTAAVAAGKQIFDLATDTGKLADELLTTSTQTGVSTQTLQEWTYAARFIDTEVDTMTGSMAKMVKQMAAASDKGSASAKAFKTLGVSLKDSSGNLRDSEDVFLDVIDALGKIPNETQRDILAMQLFGKSAQELNPLIEAGSAKLKELGLEAQNLGVVMSDETITSFGAFDDSMNVLNSTIDGVKLSFIEALLPSIQAIIPVVQDLAVQFGEWLRSDGAQQLLSDLGAKIQSVAQWLSENLETAINGVIGVFNTIISTVGWVIDNFDTLVTIGGVVIGVLTTLKIAQIAVNIAMAANPIGIVIVAITALVAAIVWLIDNWEAVKTTITQVWESIKSAVAIGVKAVEDGFNSAISFISGLISNVWTIGENLVKGIWEGIKGAYEWIKGKISGWVNGVLDWIKGVFGIASPSKKMRDLVGKPMVQGMAVGIEKNAYLVNDAMSNLVPDTRAASVALDVTRRFNDVASDSMNVTRTTKTQTTMELSESSVSGIVQGFKAVMLDQPDIIFAISEREFGRAMRRLAPA